MTYRLKFKDEALKEWHKLDNTLREQFKKKLTERMQDPRVPAAKLAGHADRYQIKLRSSGYRLVYEARDAELVVVVVAVGTGRDTGTHSNYCRVSRQYRPWPVAFLLQPRVPGIGPSRLRLYTAADTR